MYLSWNKLGILFIYKNEIIFIKINCDWNPVIGTKQSMQQCILFMIELNSDIWPYFKFIRIVNYSTTHS